MQNANKKQVTSNAEFGIEYKMQTRLRKTSDGQARNPPSETFVGRGKECRIEKALRPATRDCDQ